MASLSILLFILMLSLLADGWVLGFVARLFGSPRGRLGIGLLVAIALFAISLLFTILVELTAPTRLSTSFASLVLLIMQIAIVLPVLRHSFKLTGPRTLALFGAYVAAALIKVGLMLLVTRPLVLEAFVIPAPSMSPTIEPGDRFVANKLLSPKRMDIVAYWNNDGEPLVYCKRLIGLPGETLRFDQGELFVNDQPIPLPAVLAGRLRAAPSTAPASMARYRDGESITLGNDEYFFIGDNVDISADSRTSGPSPTSSLIGVMDLQYWPLNRVRLVR